MIAEAFCLIPAVEAVVERVARVPRERVAAATLTGHDVHVIPLVVSAGDHYAASGHRLRGKKWIYQSCASPSKERTSRGECGRR